MLAASPLHLLHRAEQIGELLFFHAFDGLDLTLRQLVLLIAVNENDGASQAQLMRATGIDRATLEAMLRRLLERGLLFRHRLLSDGRVNAVRLTAVGEQLLADAELRLTRIEDQLLAPLPGGHRAGLVTVLRAIAAAAAG